MTYCPRCSHWSPEKKVLLKKTNRTDKAGNIEWECRECGYTETRKKRVKK